MNANEVIANRAAEILKKPMGQKTPVLPNDHVNRGQSSNDTFPTAMHIAAVEQVCGELQPALGELHAGLHSKAVEFKSIVKIGRTHLQDATPLTLGQEFSGYATQVKYGLARVKSALPRLCQLAQGGTAVGTGLNAKVGFDKAFAAEVVKLTGLPFKTAENKFEALAAHDALVEMSGALNTIAASLMKIANDIRLLGSGPRCGLGELVLPANEPGSSIMPGKVNPVIAESVAMVSAQVIGNDATIAIAGQSGNFELNVMMPVAAHNLLESIDLLSTSAVNFAHQCVNGLEATGKGPEMVMQGLAIGTVLAPIIGYDAAAGIAHEASVSGENIREVALRMTDLTEEQLDEILEPLSMTEPKA